MAAQVISLFRRAIKRASDWSQQELAEFYRVQAALGHAGLRVETDRGVTDEGDPWFVFCREDDGEVVIHFARIEETYVVAASAYDGVARARDFTTLVRDLIDRHPLIQPPRRASSNVFMHPATMLVAIVATALLKTGDAQARSDDTPAIAQDDDAMRDRAGPVQRVAVASAAQSKPSVSIADAAQAATILSAISYAAHQAAGDALLAGEAAGPAQGGGGPIFASLLDALRSGASRALSGNGSSGQGVDDAGGQAPIASLSLAEQREALRVVNALMALPQAPVATVDWQALGQAVPEAGALALPQLTFEMSAAAPEAAFPAPEGRVPLAYAPEVVSRPQARSETAVDDGRAHHPADAPGPAPASSGPLPPEPRPVSTSAASSPPAASAPTTPAEISPASTAQPVQSGHAVTIDLLTAAVSHGIQITIGNGSRPSRDASTSSPAPSADDLPGSANGPGPAVASDEEPDTAPVPQTSQSSPPPRPAGETPASQAVATPSPAGGQSPAPSSVTPEQAQAAITRFVRAQPDAEQINVGRDVIYYDPDALDGNPDAIGSVNLVFSDGSRISLVGFHQDIDAAV